MPPAGNPFHPKATGYTPSVDPVTRLTEMFGKLGAVVENIFHGFTRLQDALRAVERTSNRLAAFSMIAAGGVGSRIPWDLRHALLSGGGGGGGGVGSPATVVGEAMEDKTKATQVLTKIYEGSPVSGSNGPPPLPGGAGSGGNRSRWGHFWNGFYAVGLKGAQGFWDFFKPGGGHSTFWDADKDKSHAIGHSIAGFGSRTALSSSIVTAALLKTSSPVAFDTLYKSFELFLARAGGGTTGPAMDVSRRLQNAGNWMDRNPELTSLIGKFAFFGVAVGGTIVAINMLAGAATRAAAVLSFLGSMRPGGGVPVIPPAGPGTGISTGAEVTAETAVGGTRAATAATWGSRLGGMVKGAGFTAGYGAMLEGLSKDSAVEAYEAVSVLPGMNIPGLSPAKLLRENPALNESTTRAMDFAKKYTGYRDLFHYANPFEWFKGLSDKKAAANDMLISPNSHIQPMYMDIGEVYKSVAMSAMMTPIDAKIQEEQQKNNMKAATYDGVYGAMTDYYQKNPNTALQTRP